MQQCSCADNLRRGQQREGPLNIATVVGALDRRLLQPTVKGPLAKQPHRLLD